MQTQRDFLGILYDTLVTSTHKLQEVLWLFLTIVFKNVAGHH